VRAARVLGGPDPTNIIEKPEEDINVPEEVDVALEELFHGLQDKVSPPSHRFSYLTPVLQDTIVRWSASKGIARIAERLPTDFAFQVFDTITGLFSIHSIAAASIYDMPAIAEGTWHGACLACAEMARRGLVARGKLAELVGWLSKVPVPATCQRIP
jgi:tubulin-specific chaperone D